MIPILYEPFCHWSEKGSVYILSDLHFDDADCKFMSLDWITLQEQIYSMPKSCVSYRKSRKLTDKQRKVARICMEQLNFQRGELY